MSQQLQPTSVPATAPESPVRPVDYAAHRRLHEIYFPKPLQAVIRRERARADRVKGKFCLVMFRLTPAGGKLAMLRLSRLVLSAVRTTDEVGLYDRHTVCAILPDTGPDGAMKLIRRTREACYARGMMVEPVLYTYPTEWFDGGGPGTPAASPMRIAQGEPHDVQPRPMQALLTRKPGLLKRLIDVSVAGAALAVASPVMLAVAAAIKLTDRGPVFFCQTRSGLGGVPFRIFKFRTMCVNADRMKAALRAQSEQDGPAFKMTRDPRITRVGHFLRKTSLDELPQLLNVLRGDMSLVGPRPLPVDEQAAVDPWQRARLDVLPGLTCVWQVKGRSRVSFEEWMRMDLSYAHKGQVGSDLWLMLQTIPAVLLRRGAK
jgi:lipopolysaccharide/colanic/teichoic acid biosynthesis glycosyltransferase